MMMIMSHQKLKDGVTWAGGEDDDEDDDDDSGDNSDDGDDDDGDDDGKSWNKRSNDWQDGEYSRKQLI